VLKGRVTPSRGGGSAVASTVPPLSYPPPRASRKPITGVAVSRRTTAFAVLTCLSTCLPVLAEPAGAQIIKVRRSGVPVAWTSAGVSLFQSQTVVDGRTNSIWVLEESSAAQYRASIEMPIANQSTIGIVGAYARMPFEYRLRSADEPVPSPANSCTRCDAHLDVSSIALAFHAGGGLGLHQVIDAQAGVTRFHNLRADDGRALAPTSGDTDLSFAFGYGVGYATSARFQITLVQDFGFAFHQRDGLSGGERSTIQQRMTRLSVRYGLGSRKPSV
jgi:hypothetical protein